MNGTKSTGSFLSMGVLSAVAASLCCITPVISLVAGSSSLATNVSWMQPARPFLVVFTLAALLLAWYFKLRTAKATVDDCGCEVAQRTPFLHSKLFLSLVTVLALMMLAFPVYSKVFYPSSATQDAVVGMQSDLQTAVFAIKGMTCAGCEPHVNGEVSKLKGVVEVKTSYAKGTSVVRYETKQVTLAQIKAAIAKTGYEIVSVKN